MFLWIFGLSLLFDEATKRVAEAGGISDQGVGATLVAVAGKFPRILRLRLEGKAVGVAQDSLDALSFATAVGTAWLGLPGRAKLEERAILGATLSVAALAVALAMRTKSGSKVGAGMCGVWLTMQSIYVANFRF